jgi:dihydroorotase
VMSTSPARIGRLDGYDRPLAVGAPAHLVLVDPTASRTVDPATMATRGRNTPYAGRELPGRVVATFWHGHPTVLDGRLGDPLAEQVLDARAAAGASA